ncbi:tetratricopeptide repeat protein [Paraneptunicella aestuarii]|uniref:heme biosynthesis HemY N-terminal domain-containing protein n=1 Tax=Paraneptunicella aestuarii TaxID=2831148 RepID=UPI001E465CB1|nr:heme biosynthesis HemY N-terminal domain-containing protein [Paraneptunicella aestuarii]UAA38375.1 tetratricopeptide repeat protein [Paraneptunicella aestuarii]
MIRVALFVLSLAAIAVAGMFVGPWLADHKGYVLISFGSVVVELTVISFVLLVLLAFVGLWLLKKLLGMTFGAISGSQRWFGSFSRRRIQKAFRSGMLALEEGDLTIARKRLLKARGGDFSGLDLLALGKVEKQSGNIDVAVDYWQQALEFEEAKVAASLYLSEHYSAQKDYDNAILILANLDDVHQKQVNVIEHYAHALIARGDWHTLSEKLVVWKKYLPKEKAQDWEEKAAQGTYAEIASKEGAYQLKSMWLKQPRKVRHDPANQAAYVRQLLDQAMYKDAEEALVHFQKKAPDPRLLPLFRQLRLPNPASAIKLLEGWIKKDSNNAEMLSILGDLAYQTKDYGLAAQALQKALTLRQDRSDMLLLAKVKESQHDNAGALQLYKQCMTAG